MVAAEARFCGAGIVVIVRAKFAIERYTDLESVIHHGQLG